MTTESVAPTTSESNGIPNSGPAHPANIAAMVDIRAIETIMPKVTEAAFRARYHADKAAIQAMAETVRAPTN